MAMSQLNSGVHGTLVNTGVYLSPKKHIILILNGMLNNQYFFNS